MAKRYFRHKGLIHDLRSLNRKGGRFATAVKEIQALQYRIQIGEEDPFTGMRQTKHGESRIANCIKYDLTGFVRLVSVLYGDVQILLFAGDHEDEEKWLDNHKGVDFAIDRDGKITEIMVSRDAADEGHVRIAPKPDLFDGPILSRLPFDEATNFLDRLSGGATYQLQQLKVGATPEMISSFTDLISNSALRLPVYDVMMLLNAGDVDGARNRIRLMDGQLRPLSSLSPDEVLDIKDGDGTKQIKIGSDDYQKWVQEYIKSSTYFDWFLFMHPEQERYVEENYPGPAKLSGISGSGKTCIAVRRAIRLASDNAESRVAIVTLNRSLAQLIRALVDHASAEDSLRKRIEVTSLFALCQDLLADLEPEKTRLYNDVTWKLEEHIDEVYREYYRLANNFSVAEAMLPLHRQLVANGIDAETYIRDEFDWLRSALPFDRRNAYLEMERAGRGMKLSKDQRKMVLGGLHGWEAKMASVGVIDYMGLTTAISRHIDRLTPRYSAIIVDEAQDFGTTELAILRKLVLHGSNDLFFCGDLAQHILPKHLIFKDAGVDIHARSYTIRRNYRNSREILKAAYEILYNNLNEEMFKGSELELLDPEYANRSSAAPVVLRASNVTEEIKAAILLMKDNEDNYKKEKRAQDHRGCIAIAGHTLYEVSIFGKEHGIPVLDGTFGLREGSLFLSDLEQTKGYEFDTMVVVNCTDETLPPKGVPEDEAFRFGCQLYVAMTRAKDQLVLSYSGEASAWLKAKGVNIDFDDWENYVDLSDGDDIGSPGYLPENVEADEGSDDVMLLNGREFLFTSYALGLKAEVQEKIEQLVSGRTVMRGKHRVEWMNVGLLRDDLVFGHNRGRMGFIFGPTADGEVREALERAKSGLRPVARKKKVKLEIVVPSASVSEDKPRVEVPPKADTAELQITHLDLEPRTHVVLHEMKVRTVGDIIELGFLGLAKNGKLSRFQIDSIDRALRRWGKYLPEGDVKKEVRFRRQE